MSRPQSLFPIVATLSSAFVIVACVFLLPELAQAGEDKNIAPCSCPESQKSTKPKFAGIGGGLDESDELAALESMHTALTKVGDGASYVWHRANGRLSGIVQPTRSFRNVAGSVCRHVIVLLTTGDKTQKTEGIACRTANGVWRLEG